MAETRSPGGGPVRRLWSRLRSWRPGLGPRWVSPPAPDLVPPMGDRSEQWLLNLIDELRARGALDEGHGETFDNTIENFEQNWQKGDPAQTLHYLREQERLQRMLIDLEAREARLLAQADAADRERRAIDDEIAYVLGEIRGVRGNGTAPRGSAPGPSDGATTRRHPDDPMEGDDDER